MKQGKPGFGVVYEDEEFAVFEDRSPGSKVHLLAVPKKHIGTHDCLETNAREKVIVDAFVVDL